MKNLLIPMVILLLSSCSSLTVTYDYDKQANFNDYKTYSILPWDKQNDSVVNPFEKERILSSLKDQMNLRGYTYTEDNGDLSVSIYITLKNQTGYTSYTDHFGMYGGGWGYGVPWGFYGPMYDAGPSVTTTTPFNYTEGTFVLDVFQTQGKKLVWQAVGKGVVGANPQKAEQNIQNGMAKMFADFPKKPISKK